MRRASASAVLFCVSAVAGSGHGQEPPSFPAAATVLTLEVAVVGDDGAPIADLRPEEFKIALGGKSRAVAFAEYQRLGRRESDGPSSPPRFSSNAQSSPGRVVAIVVDRDHLSGGGARAVLSAADRLFDALGPADRVALATLPPSAGLAVATTAEIPRVRESLQRIVGTIAASRTRVQMGEALAIDDHGGEIALDVLGRECANQRGRLRAVCMAEVRTDARMVAGDTRQSSLRTVLGLRTLVESLGRLPGRKTLVLVSEGFFVQDRSSLDTLSAAFDSAEVDLAVLLLQSLPPDSAVGRMASSGASEAGLLAGGLEALAAETGGAIYRVSGGGEGAFLRVAREMSGRYQVGFELLEGDADGKSHPLKVEVARPHAAVRAKATVRVPRSTTVAPRDEDVLAAALRAPGQLVGLPVRVNTFTVREPGKSQVRVLISAEMGGASTRSDGVSVAFLLRDERGKVVASGMESVQDTQDGARVPFVGAAAAAPGQYTLKLAALDRRGRRGSVEHPVNAVLTDAGEVSLSDFILTKAEASGSLRPGIEAEAARGALGAYLELYALDPGVLARATVTVEVASDDDAPSMLSVPLRMATTLEADRRVAQGRLTVDRLSPGDYVARAIVQLSGLPVRRMSRPFRVVE